MKCLGVDVFPLGLFLAHVLSPSHYLVWNGELSKHSTMIWTQVKCVRNAHWNAAFQNVSIHAVQNEINRSSHRKGAAEGPAIVMVFTIHNLQPPHACKFVKKIASVSHIQFGVEVSSHNNFFNVNAQLHPTQRAAYHKHFASPPLNILHGAYTTKRTEHNDAQCKNISLSLSDVTYPARRTCFLCTNMATPAACVAISDVYKTCPPSKRQRPRALRVSLNKITSQSTLYNFAASSAKRSYECIRTFL